MKKVLFLTILMSFVAMLKAQNENKPVLSFDEDTFDFGVLEEGDTGFHTFWFTNTGNSELKIKQAHPACGCTLPTYSSEGIAPGKRGFVKIEFHSKNFGGQKVLKEVIIISNADEKYARFKADIKVKKSSLPGP